MLLAGGFLLGSLVFGPGIEYAVGALVGIMLTPDLDVDGGYIGNKIIRSRFGSLAEKAWSGLWFLYRGSIKHGSELSHFPIVSTVFRLVYLYLILLVVPYTIIGLALPGAWDVAGEFRWWNGVILSHYRIILGLMGSDLIHWALDVMTTEHKKQTTKPMIFGMPLASSACK